MGRAWDEIAGGLADRWYLYAPDHRGHGRSSRPGAYSVELMRDDVLGLMDLLGLDRVSLVGHSLGGVVAHPLAEQSPDRVERLVLEEAPPPFPLGLATPQRPDGPVAFDWAARPAIVGQLNAPDPAWWAEIPQVRAPTLVIAGGVDSHLPQDICPTTGSRKWPPDPLLDAWPQSLWGTGCMPSSRPGSARRSAPFSRLHDDLRVFSAPGVGRPSRGARAIARGSWASARALVPAVGRPGPHAPHMSTPIIHQGRHTPPAARGRRR
ncbi:alpha/beta fold hydrolase [Streptomyces mirabilis]|uniref:alpha/beta fold hydrolase n=1 Tax=Streptomyces mirabilis TaxID=68239 RepID=UPI003320749D